MLPNQIPLRAGTTTYLRSGPPGPGLGLDPERVPSTLRPRSESPGPAVQGIRLWTLRSRRRSGYRSDRVPNLNLEHTFGRALVLLFMAENAVFAFFWSVIVSLHSFYSFLRYLYCFLRNISENCENRERCISEFGPFVTHLIPHRAPDFHGQESRYVPPLHNPSDEVRDEVRDLHETTSTFSQFSQLTYLANPSKPQNQGARS